MSGTLKRYLAILFLPCGVFAQTPPPAVPDPKPPALEILDDSVQADEVVIRKRGEETVEEHRLNGRVYKVVITPENGPPYTLIDPKGDGNFIPSDGGMTPPMSVPMWEVGKF